MSSTRLMKCLYMLYCVKLKALMFGVYKEPLRPLIVLVVQEEVHIAAGPPQRTLVALRPLAWANHVVVMALRYSLTVYTRVYLPLADYIL